MELPSEIWTIVAHDLSTRDKCSLIATCKRTQVGLYSMPYWLDFTLANILRGLTIEEIVVIVFLKTDQDRLAKSRISTFKNYIKNHPSFTEIDIPAILDKHAHERPTAVQFGEYAGIAWRVYPHYRFAATFAALFCNIESLKLTSHIGEEEFMHICTAHGHSLKSIEYDDSTYCTFEIDFPRLLPNLEKFRGKGANLHPSVIESLGNNCPRLKSLAFYGGDDECKSVYGFRNLTKLVNYAAKEDTDVSSKCNAPLIKQNGSTLESLRIDELSAIEQQAILEHCKTLKELKIKWPRKSVAFDLFAFLEQLALNNAEFPRNLFIGKEKYVRARYNDLLGDSLMFFKQYGSRLKVLHIRGLNYAQIDNLQHATNLEKLSLVVKDEALGVNESHVTVPFIIQQLTKLRQLDLRLSTRHPTIIRHDNVTKLYIQVHNAIVDIPPLVEAEFNCSILTIDRCSLKRIAFDKDLLTFNILRVDWPSVEHIDYRLPNYGFISFAQDHMPEGVQLKKGCLDGVCETAFQMITNQSLMPPCVNFDPSLLVQEEFIKSAPFAMPKSVVYYHPLEEAASYSLFATKLKGIESLDLFQCGNLTPEILDILMKGLTKLKMIGFTESRDVTSPFAHLKIHSPSLEVLYLYHIHSVETSDIVCPNLKAIKYDNAGRYEFLEDVTDTNFCESTIQLIGETNSCPNLMSYHAYPTQTSPMSEVKPPPKPVVLTKIPSNLQDLNLYLNSNLVGVDLESDSLTDLSLSGCYHLKSIRVKAPLVSCALEDLPALKSVSIESKFIKSLSLLNFTGSLIIELRTPRLEKLQTCAQRADVFLDHVPNLRVLELNSSEIVRVSTKILFAKLLQACPRLTTLKWNEKYVSLSASSLVSLKDSFMKQYGTDLVLEGPRDVLQALEALEANKKLPQRKQQMLHINGLMKRTIANLKQRPKAKAFRAWRDYAARDKKHEH